MVNQYNRSFFASVLVHVLLLVFLLISANTNLTHKGDPVAAVQPEIVQAVVIDEGQVAAAVNQLQSEEKQKAIKEAEKQQQMDAKVAALKAERQKEQAKLDKLKLDMAKAKQEEQDRLAEIKIAKEKEQKQLEKLKTEKEKEKKQLVALDDERQVEQDRVQQLKVEREKEEKKKKEAKQKLEAKNQADAAKKQAEEAKRIAAAKAAKEAERVAAERQAGIETEKDRITALWENNIKFNRNEAMVNLQLEKGTLTFKVLPDGSVNGVQITKSCGNKAVDDDAVKAVYKSVPFSLSEDKLVQKRLTTETISLEFSRDD